MIAKARTAPASRKTPPAGKAHAHCLDHVAHPAGPSGWLCITTRTEDVTWPHQDQYRPSAGEFGPFLPASLPDWQPVDRAADMVAFADHIARIAAEHRAAELARRASLPALTAADYEIDDPVPGRPDLRQKRYPRPTGAAYAGSGHLPYDRAEDRARRAEMAAQLRERTGRTYTGRRAPVVPFVAPAPEPGSPEALAEGMREFARDMIASGRELGILPGPPERAPDALTRCNSCEIETADPDSLAGYCTACMATGPETAEEIAYSAPELVSDPATDEETDAYAADAAELRAAMLEGRTRHAYRHRTNDRRREARGRPDPRAQRAPGAHRAPYDRGGDHRAGRRVRGRPSGPSRRAGRRHHADIPLVQRFLAGR